MNRKMLFPLSLAVLLSACASNNGGHSEAYGQISGGIETSHTRGR